MVVVCAVVVVVVVVVFVFGGGGGSIGIVVGVGVGVSSFLMEPLHLFRRTQFCDGGKVGACANGSNSYKLQSENSNSLRHQVSDSQTLLNRVHPLVPWGGAGALLSITRCSIKYKEEGSC